MNFFKGLWKSVVGAWDRAFNKSNFIEIVVAPDGDAKRELVQKVANRLTEDLGYKLDAPFLKKEKTITDPSMVMSSELVDFLESPTPFYEGWEVKSSRGNRTKIGLSPAFNWDVIFLRGSDHVTVSFKLDQDQEGSYATGILVAIK